jgi:hypothetical protein
MKEEIERDIEYLNRNKIVYRLAPWTDTPSKVYKWGMYFENGTHQCYELFRTKAKIRSYKSFKWHLIVLLYLNPQLSQDEFVEVAQHVRNKSSGFVAFKTPDGIFDTIMYDVFCVDMEIAPTNSRRKIIFNDGCGLNVGEKLSIVGSIIGRSRKVTEQDVYETMLYLNDLGNKITISKLAEALKCTARTIHRNMGYDLKKEKISLNNSLK